MGYRLVELPIVIWVGRSNVGKSSIINAIAGNTALAHVSSKPGTTKVSRYDYGSILIECD
jgi:GTP-binding protein